MRTSKNLSGTTTTTAVSNELRTAYNVYVGPKLTADWNMNRYYAATVSNSVSESDFGYDIESFPIASIVEANRPNKGIVKAIVNQSLVTDSFINPNEPRFYVAGPEDYYKYWTSPDLTNPSGVFPTSNGVSTASPKVEYGNQDVKVTKIVIRIENSWATPATYDVRIKNSSGTWSKINNGTAGLNNATGVLTLYYTSGGWVATKPAVTQSTTLRGIEFRVNTMGPGYGLDGVATSFVRRVFISGTTWGQPVPGTTNGGNSSLNLISIEPHYEVDLTDRLINFDSDFEISASDELYPVGTITTNQATVTLSNHDKLLNPENDQSPFYNIMEPGVEMNLEYIYTIGGVQHSVQGFKMNAVGAWDYSDSEVTVTLEDSSHWLKEAKVSPVLYENKSIQEIAWRILDSVGFNNYVISDSDSTLKHAIPYFWADGEKTVWEILDELAQASQTTFYFDADNILRVKMREEAFNSAATPVWRLLGNEEGTSLADIQEWNIENEIRANKITVNYKTTKWATNRKGKPALAKVWEPEGDLVVRSAQLVQPMTASDTILTMSQKDVELWPFSGYINIDGEILKYEGKRYMYYDFDGTVRYATVKDQDEVNRYDYRNRNMSRGNHFTGGLQVTKRGAWNTTATEHRLDLNGWTGKSVVITNGTGFVNDNFNAGFKHNKQDSLLEINGTGSMKDSNDTYWVQRGTTTATGYKAYGTRLRIDGGSTSRAGLGFHISNSRNDGYYVELCLSSDLTGDSRKDRNEVMIYSKVGDDWKVIAKGSPTAVEKKIFYDIDVYVNKGSQDIISVWVNGQKVASGTTTSGTKQAETGKFALYTRGVTQASFEYFYGISREIAEPTEDFGFYDLKYGGIRGKLWQREYVWKKITSGKRNTKQDSNKEKTRRSGYIFDEFGPYAHEVREFDVKFTETPVQYSYLFRTNTWDATTVEYWSTPFTAHFVIANMSRSNAIIQGEDRLKYAGGSGAVNQVTTVLGRTLSIEGEEKVVKTNEDSIRTHGKVEIEINSDWIQSKNMADSIGDWVVNHWTKGVDTCTAKVFGNPLFELTDVVDVRYDLKNMTPTTHKYYITKINNSWDNGVQTTLTLRRVR